MQLEKQPIIMIEYTDEDIIEERNKAVQKIATDMQSLHEIFRDMQILVIEQGTDVDNIESSMNMAVQHSKKAVVEIQRAESNQTTGIGCMAKSLAGSFVAGLTTAAFLIVLL